ncbi:zinc finger B-box domain-containing protein 1 isoform X2 [Acipenser ruthenus]|uniref:zinc finger B-box domain-containing protein 1 isoform X2 n=1 Tax=Acipenser ruthenus TaxID=7906 RepID=UPI0027412EEE|nr:zinc finger B-box domain-containing protein 1 isoform X2 [Acipenser ruthenus]
MRLLLDNKVKQGETQKEPLSRCFVFTEQISPLKAMNLNDFIVVTNQPNSVKLKNRNVREMRLETVQLELESKDMESRLQQLRLSMSREKDEREKSGGFHWRSGQAGALATHPHGAPQNKENNLQKLSAGKVKIKILKDQSEELRKPPESYRSPVGMVRSGKPKLQGKICGQCESKKAGLVCMECGEDYCVSCFAKFHQKGALKLHRMIPLQMEIQTSISTLDVVSQFKKQIDPEESSVKSKQKDVVEEKQSPVRNLLPPPKKNTDAEVSILDHGNYFEVQSIRKSNQDKGLLLSGSFDEEESAKSFQQVLMEWRTGKENNDQAWRPYEAVPVFTGVSAVQADLSDARKPVDIEFSEHSLSYMERLLLKKHRRTPVQQCGSMSLASSLQIPLMESNMLMDEEGLSLTAEEMEEHRYYTALFTVEEFHQQTGSSLSILELDEALKEHLEETNSYVVEEAENVETREKKLTQLRENLYCTQLNLSFDKRSEMSAVQESKNLGMSSLMSTLSEDEKTLSSSRKTSTSANKQRLLSAGKTSSTNVRLSRSLSVSAKTERMAQNSPRRPKQKQRQKNEKQTTSEPLKSHNTPQRTSLLLNVSLEDAASTADEGPGRNYLLANDSTTESTDVGLSVKPSMALRELAQRQPVEEDHYTGLNGFFTLGLDPAQISPDPFPQRAAYQSVENKQDFQTEERGGWRPSSNLSEYAEEMVVSSVIGSARSRPPSSLGQQITSGRITSSMQCHASSGSLIYSPRPISAHTSFHSAAENKTFSSSWQKSAVSSRPVSAHARPLSRATVEIMEIESVDPTENDDPGLENEADNCALACLEEEFKMLRNHEDEEKSAQNSSSQQEQFVFRSQERSRTKQTRNISPKSWDAEGHTDDEEDILRDKQNVMSLP